MSALTGVPHGVLSAVTVCGRTMSIRHVLATDATGLHDLYEALDPDDRYKRFFCGYRPPPSFFDRMVTLAPGEARLIAEVVDERSTTIVGEAGYVVLPNGNGELGIAVARRWRGFLGSHLIDLLRRQAAQRGVPNLEAEVLAINPAMLHLMRARHAVVVDHDGWTSWRLMIGTAGDPTWPPHDHRPRVLVESPGAPWRLDESPLTAGMQIVTCNGPTSRRPCPELARMACPLASGADVIVVASRHDGDVFDEIAEAHRRLHPSVPVAIDRDGEHSLPTVAATIEEATATGAAGEIGSNGPTAPTGD